MPTGYTECIEKGASFKEFALICAKGMGACVMQRDESLDTPIKMDKVDDYHIKAYDEAKIELQQFNNLSNKELIALYNKETKKTNDINKKIIAEKEELLSKYLLIKKEVVKWIPPTKDHENFKRFMLEQIDDSIKFDCDISYYKRDSVQYETWLKQRICRLTDNISYHLNEYNKEIERVRARNEWKKALLDSLNDKY